MAYHLLSVTTEGYSPRESFAADSLHAAATAATEIYRNRARGPWAVILRDGLTGKRYSIAQCEQIIAAALGSHQGKGEPG